MPTAHGPYPEGGRRRPRPVIAVEAYDALRTVAGLPSAQARIPLVSELLVDRLRLTKEAEPWNYPEGRTVTVTEREAIARHFGTSRREAQQWWEAAGLGSRELVTPFQWEDDDQRNAERWIAGEDLHSIEDWPGMTNPQRHCAWDVYQRLQEGPAFWDDSLTDWDPQQVQAPAIRYLFWAGHVIPRSAPGENGRQRTRLELSQAGV